MSAECSKVLIDAAGGCSPTNQKYAIGLVDCATEGLITVGGAIQFWNSAGPGWTTGAQFDKFNTDAEAYAKQTEIGHFENGCDKTIAMRVSKSLPVTLATVGIKLQGKVGGSYYDIDISGLLNPAPEAIIETGLTIGEQTQVAQRFAAFEYYRLIVRLISGSLASTLTVRRVADGFGTTLNTWSGPSASTVTTSDIPAPSSNVFFRVEVS